MLKRASRIRIAVPVGESNPSDLLHLFYGPASAGSVNDLNNFVGINKNVQLNKKDIYFDVGIFYVNA